MSALVVRGLGAVSPAGWGVPALLAALDQGERLGVSPLARPGWATPLLVQRVPAPTTRSAAAGHPRMRRASAISQYAVAAALEALGSATTESPAAAQPLGIIFCTTCGSVVYSRRFFDEVLTQPALASPLLFPETVFNAPSSHVSAVLGSSARNDTLVGDSGVLLQGLALAGQWLEDGCVGSCLVVAAEELDWVTADAWKLFARARPLSEGAAAFWLRWEPEAAGQVRIDAISSPQVYRTRSDRAPALARVLVELGGTAGMVPPCSRTERVFGEGFAAATGWECLGSIAAARAAGAPDVHIAIPGAYQEAIGLRLVLT